MKTTNSAILALLLAGTQAASFSMRPPSDSNVAYPVDYKVPNFGVDKDIKDTLSSLKTTEKTFSINLIKS